MSKVEIVDLPLICQSFPENAASSDGSVSSTIINRSNIIDTIKTIFDGETHLIGVEGSEGIGKTTLLAQFALNNPDNTISLFIKCTSRWGYDPETLKYDLCNQISWALSKKFIEEQNSITDAFLRNILMRLHFFARINNKKYYFVVDGLEEIPDELYSIKEQILDMLPIGFSNFRFLLSGEPNKLLGSRNGIKTKSFPLTGFTLDETKKFFSDISINAKELEEIYLTCKRIPGNLATVKRILQKEQDINSFLAKMSEEMPELFEIEWTHVNQKDNLLLNILGILAFDLKKHTLEELSAICETNVENILQLLKQLTFIDIQSDYVKYISESFRKFATKKLNYIKESIFDLIINHLIKAPESESSLNLLPGYYEQTGRFQDLLNYLSPEHFTKILKNSQSLSFACNKAELGIVAAKKLCRNGDIMRFGLQKSIIKGLNGTEIWRSEIEANMDLKNYESTIALAQSAILKEERLCLLALVGKKMKEHGQLPEPELIEQIQNLYKQIDPSSLVDDDIIDLASDLIYTCPDLAIELIEKTTNNTPGENALDWAFAKLSILSLKDNNESQLLSTIDNISLRIKDPIIRRLSTSISIFVKNYSSKELMAEVKKLENASDQLYMLRQWTKINWEREDTFEVIDYALKLAMKTTAYAPNATVYRELASPLPYVRDIDKVKCLVSTFDSQKDTIEHLGPTEDYIRLQLLLAETEFKYDVETAKNRIIDIYLYISELEDLSVKASCMAKLVTLLAKIDSNMILEEKDEIISLTQNDLNKDVEKLLSSTADHYHVMRDVIKSLSKMQPEIALKFISRVNMESRRNFLLIDFIKSILQFPIKESELFFFEKALDQISLLDLKDEALLIFCERLQEISDPEIISKAIPFFNRIKDIQSASERCRACCLAVSILKDNNTYNYCAELISSLLNILDISWESIDVGWHKIDIGYKIISALANHFLDTAKEYLNKTEEFKKNIGLEAGTIAGSLIYSIYLAIRAFSGLLKNKVDVREEIDKIRRLIDYIPSSGERAILWSELASYYYIHTRFTEGHEIVNQYLKPCLQDISEGDIHYFQKIIIVVAPSLYCAHKLTAFEQIDNLSLYYRDSAYRNICDFIFTKVPIHDPFENVPDKGFNISYQEMLDIIEILQKIDDDSLIYQIINEISDSINSHRTQFSKQQIKNIEEKLRSIVYSKLPNMRNIQHDGYKVASLAQIARIGREKSHIWDNLIKEAKNIPNLADRALVLAIISVSMPTSFLDKASKLFKEAKELVDQIPAIYDKIERYENLASMALQLDTIMARSLLKDAMKLATESNDPDITKIQKRIIDLSYRLDPDLASSLASLADDDEARKGNKLKRQLEFLKFKNEMLQENSLSVVDDKITNGENYSKAAWMLLGSLNAERVATLHIDSLRDYLQLAAQFPLSDSYPIHAWVIENAKRRFAKTEQSITILRSLFEATLLGAELSLRLAEHSSDLIERVKKYSKVTYDHSSILINANDREAAIKFLKEWIELEVKDYLKICDRFFGPEELELLKLILEVKPKCKVRILTSIMHHNNLKLPQPWPETYAHYWHHISDQEPPETEIFLVGKKSNGDFLIHDRWWISKSCGLRIGTSFNSLGISKSTEISKLSKEEVDIREREIDQYFLREIHQYNGEKVVYQIFTL